MEGYLDTLEVDNVNDFKDFLIASLKSDYMWFEKFDVKRSVTGIALHHYIGWKLETFKSRQA
jgi:hypothetical protein